MYSNLVFAIPGISLIFLFQTIFAKSVKKGWRISLVIISTLLFLFDLLVSLYFYTSCYEISYKYGVETCLSWIYPTLDFKIMVVISVLILTLAMWGLVDGWKKKAFYLLGGAELFLGVGFRLAILFQSVRVVAISGSVNTSVIFEFFTILVVYGLVSAAIYIGVSLIGIFRSFSKYME